MVERKAIKATTGQRDDVPLFAVDQVCFGYGQQPLLYDVAVTVQQEEMIGLLGPNGSGKTTLLRLLSGVLQPQQGRILLQGRDLRKWGRRQVARRVAVVPQELHMPFAYTVAQMVDMGRTPFVRSFWGERSKDDQRIVRHAMSAAGVEPFADRIFNELSGGEQQRVTVAMALAQQPLALLLDEPTAHLDIKYQIEILELARTLNEQHGVTIIAAMHDLNLAARYFPRLLLFQRGIVADGSPAEVLATELLSRVYGVDVQVGILRGSEYLSVLPPSSAAADSGSQADDVLMEESSPIKPFVHVIAGGGSGELLMRALADAQIPFSAGVLNIGDSDHTLALRLAEDVLSEQPFAPVSPALLAQLRERLQRVAVLVICPTAIGPGNLALLQVASEAAQQGLAVVLFNGAVAASDTSANAGPERETALVEMFAARDYTGGAGVAYLQQIVQQGATLAASIPDVLAAVRQYVDSADRV
jgi:ABC-type cobalamin/Fe3+-siderophores transport systems, ATPase components